MVGGGEGNGGGGMVVKPVAETKEASCGRGVVAGGSGAATLTAVATKQLPLGLVPVTATTCPGNSLKEGTCSHRDTTAIILPDRCCACG